MCNTEYDQTENILPPHMQAVDDDPTAEEMLFGGLNSGEEGDLRIFLCIRAMDVLYDALKGRHYSSEDKDMPCWQGGTHIVAWFNPLEGKVFTTVTSQTPRPLRGEIDMDYPIWDFVWQEAYLLNDDPYFLTFDDDECAAEFSLWSNMGMLISLGLDLMWDLPYAYQAAFAAEVLRIFEVEIDSNLSAADQYWV